MNKLADVRRDCNELPVSIDDLSKLASSTKVNSMEDFLKAIPQGSMGTFTFVTNSQSLQRGDPLKGSIVNPMWPRVIRTTADGKLTLTFVCDPKNSAYGTVEAIYFDEKTQSLQTKEFQFTDNTLHRTVPPNHRIQDNPDSCVNCHSSRKENSSNNQSPAELKKTIKYNWAEYYMWGDCVTTRGITLYGADDDLMRPGDIDYFTFRGRMASDDKKYLEDCDDKKDKLAHQQELVNYQDFREKQKDNPCFNTLPWSKNDQTKTYPYENGQSDYSLQPNLRLTNSFVDSTAKRNLQLFKETGQAYNVMKYYLAIEAAGCLSEDDREKIKKLFGSQFSPPDIVLPKYDRYSAPSDLIAGFGKNAGFTSKDWNLDFLNDKNSYSYQDGLQANPSAVLGGLIVKDIAANNPKIADASNQLLYYARSDSYSRGQLKDNTHDYACVTKDGPTLTNYYGTEYSRESLCSALHSENEKNLADPKNAAYIASLKDSSCKDTGSAPAQPASLLKTATDANQTLTLESITRGKSLVQTEGKGHCVNCHSNDSPGFVPSDHQSNSLSILKARMQEPSFMSRLTKNLNDNSMPPDNSHLSAQDMSDIAAYVQSLNP